ncbi:helix-turn-helix domain-containing protein [Methylocystis sp. ATCC 49242]|uniref:helix-turn-helix domain-containing protein n=1 Tax=Methylocystis sp. ATCC 49242 TaxID=622637 RepID=UPI0035280C46
MLALNLRKLRRARGWSQEELAHRAEIDRTYISAIERRLYAASVDVLERLAISLEIEASELIRSSGDRKSGQSCAMPVRKLPLKARKERPSVASQVDAQAGKARRRNHGSQQSASGAQRSPMTHEKGELDPKSS